ncbi:hypothetical protein KM043_011962 [Ampulex compressa]|nr:hypothetical protein KM043_011962 [Ampulex compressa]
MKSLLVFIPQRFCKEEPGYMFGKVVHEDTGVKKFYIIGIHRITATERIKLNADIVGYYSGRDNTQKHPDRKYQDWITIVIIDIFLGIFVIEFLLHYLGDTSPSDILLNNAEAMVEALKNLINWLMGAPAGLKLNHALNNILGKFFLYHIHLWWTFLIFMTPVMDFAFEVLLFLGRLGITFQISIAADLLAIISFHTYCIYVYAARLFNIQLKGITALFRLFLGKKKNPLRERVDSWQYQPNQLFIGTVLFTILLFLMPTTWVYYTVFTMLRLALIAVGGFLTRLKFYLQVMPVYTFCKWLFHSHSACSTIDIKLNSNYVKEPITLLMTMVVAPWNQTWRKCVPDTIACHPPIKWNEIVNNIIWGELLYPL